MELKEIKTIHEKYGTHNNISKNHPICSCGYTKSQEMSFKRFLKILKSNKILLEEFLKLKDYRTSIIVGFLAALDPPEYLPKLAKSNYIVKKAIEEIDLNKNYLKELDFIKITINNNDILKLNIVYNDSTNKGSKGITGFGPLVRHNSRNSNKNLEFDLNDKYELKYIIKRYEIDFRKKSVVKEGFIDNFIKNKNLIFIRFKKSYYSRFWFNKKIANYIIKIFTPKMFAIKRVERVSVEKLENYEYLNKIYKSGKLIKFYSKNFDYTPI